MENKQRLWIEVKKGVGRAAGRLESLIQRAVEGKPKKPPTPELLRDGERLLHTFDVVLNAPDFLDPSVTHDFVDPREIVDSESLGNGVIGYCDADVVTVTDAQTKSERKVAAVEVWMRLNALADGMQPKSMMIVPPNSPADSYREIVMDRLQNSMNNGSKRTKFTNRTALPGSVYLLEETNAVRLAVEVVDADFIHDGAAFAGLRLKLHVIKKPKLGQ